MAKQVKYSAQLHKSSLIGEIIFFIVMAILLFYPPFVRGLFFDTEFMYFHMFSAAAALFYFLALRKDRVTQINRNIMDWAGIGLIVAYFISCFVAYNDREAVAELFRVINLFLIYYLVSHGLKTRENLYRMLVVVYLSGIGVALMGVGASYGTVDYNGAFVEGMINSTLQYHNAAAIYMAAAAILGFYLAVDLKQLWQRLAVTAGNFLLITALLGAQSRGALLVFLFTLVVMWILMPKAIKMSVILNSVIALVATVALSKFTLAFGQYTQLASWGYILAGATLAIVLQYAKEWLDGQPFMHTKQVKYGLIGAVVVVGLAGVVLFGGKLMPENIGERFQNLSLTQYSTLERFYFWKDAVAISEHHPLFGTGGGGWNATYRMYQSYDYSSTEVHNHFLQILVETGLVGFAFYLALWGGLVWSTLRLLRRSENGETKALAVTAFMAALTIGLHSAMDFSLSLGSVAIFMWFCFGVVRGLYKDEGLDVQLAWKLPTIYVKVLGSLVALGLVVVAFSFSMGEAYMNKTATAYQQQNLPDASINAESAVKYDSINPQYLADTAKINVIMSQQTGSNSYLDRAVEYGIRSVEHGKGNTLSYWTLGEIYLRKGEIAKGVEMFETAKDFMPLREEGYQQLLLTYVNVAKSLMSQGRNEEAKTYLQKAITIPDQINQQLSKIEKNAMANWKARGGPLSVTEEMTKTLDEAKTLLSQI